MVDKIQTGFEPESVTIKVKDILPLKKIPASVRKGRKYRQITAAIREIGIVQPPIVTRHPKLPGKFLLLEGHLRIEVLKDLGIEEVICLISSDDEAFTYNRQVNRLATIQEHRMILKLVERGVSEQRIAEALDVNVASIRARLNLLHGICPEAAELLKDKQCPMDTIRALKKMKPVRQVDAVDMMIEMNNYTVPYAKALVASTPPEQLVDTDAPRAPKGVSADQIARMEREMASLQRGIKRIEATFGPDHLNLVLGVRYVESLLSNEAIDRYLDKHHPELREELVRTCEATVLASDTAE